MTYDLISRQAAIEAVESLIVKGYDLRTMDRNAGICKARDELLKLPSEQPGCLDEDGTLFTVVANPYEVKKVIVAPDGFSDYLYVFFYPSERDTPKRVLWSGWKGCRYTRYNCPNCKKPVRNDDVYCHRCGQRLVFPKISFTPYIKGQKQDVIVRWDDEG